jgi:hypothetical protein
VLLLAAQHGLASGDLERAEAQAAEALQLARAVGRVSEAAAATALLASLAWSRGDRAMARTLLAPLREEAAEPGRLSAQARAIVRDAARPIDGEREPAPA